MSSKLRYSSFNSSSVGHYLFVHREGFVPVLLEREAAHARYNYQHREPSQHDAIEPFDTGSREVVRMLCSSDLEQTTRPNAYFSGASSAAQTVRARMKAPSRIRMQPNRIACQRRGRESHTRCWGTVPAGLSKGGGGTSKYDSEISTRVQMTRNAITIPRAAAPRTTSVLSRARACVAGESVDMRGIRNVCVPPAPTSIDRKTSLNPAALSVRQGCCKA